MVDGVEEAGSIRKEIIEAEVVGFKQKYASEHGGNDEGYAFSLLNNFSNRMPLLGGEGPFSNARTMIGERWDIPFGQFHPEKDRYSSKFLAQTPRQFFADFDKAIDENVVDKESLMDLRRKDIAEAGFQENLYEALIPVYIGLRTMGYSRDDLTI